MNHTGVGSTKPTGGASRGRQGRCGRMGSNHERVIGRRSGSCCEWRSRRWRSYDEPAAVRRSVMKLLTPDPNRRAAAATSTARRGRRASKLAVFIRPPAIHDAVGGHPAGVIGTNAHRSEAKPAGNAHRHRTEGTRTAPRAVSQLATVVGAPAVCLTVGRYPAAMPTHTHHLEGKTA